MTKYKEIFKLKEMLEKLDLNPPIEFFDRNITDTTVSFVGLWCLETFERYQILVYKKNGKRFMSIIEGYGTYGADDDKLEIMADFIEDDVMGHLTAQEVFDLILNNYEVE